MKISRIIRALLAAALLAANIGTASEFRPFDATSMEAIKTAYAGRAFILAFWSIHCAPCIEDMPDWRALRRSHPGVPILLVSTDPPAERTRVSQVLAAYTPGDVERWAFSDDFEERIRYSVDHSWRGELPRTYFYDGVHAVEVISGRLDRRWVEAWLSRVR